MANRVYETAIKIGASISKAFSRDTYDAAKALTKLSSATSQLKAAEKSAAAYKKLDAAVTASKAKYDQASASLRALEAAEKAAGGATKESTKWRKAGEREVARAAREMDRATKAADKNSKALRAMGVDTANLTKEQERLARALSATERREHALTRFEGARTRLFGSRKEPTPLIQKAGTQIRSIANDALLLGTAATGAGIAMAGLVHRTIKTGDEIGDTAEKLGVGAEVLQELRFGAKVSGAEAEELDKSLGKMLVTIGKFKNAKGKGGAGAGFSIPGMQMLGEGGEHKDSAAAGEIDPFKRLGLNAKALAALKPEQQIGQIADKFATLKTHADRAAMAQAIFGKGGVALVPMLMKGSAGIAKMSAEGHRFGGIMSEDAVRAAGEADDAMREAEMAFSGMANTLGAALLPTAVKTFKTFSGWVAENRGQIQKWAEGAAKWIEDKGIPAFKQFSIEIKSIAAKVINLVQVGAKLTGGFGNLAAVMVGLRLAPLATTLGQIAIEGTKAAIAIFKYATAAKAARDAGGVGGFEPGALTNAGRVIGAAASASMVIGAASVGYAIGSFLDEKFGISDWLAGTGRKMKQDKNGQIQKEGFGEGVGWLERKLLIDPAIDKGNEGISGHQAKLAKVKALQKKGLSYEAASGVVFRGVPAVIPKGGGGQGGAPVNVTNNFYGADSRDDIARKMDEAKQKALEAYDRREANRKRLAFNE